MLPGKQYTPVDYGTMALRWWWVIVTPALIGLYVGLVVSSRQVDTYESDMLIQVIPQQIPSSFVQSTVTLRTVDRLSALTAQIMSRTEIERLITDMNLYPEERSKLPMQDVVEMMQREKIQIQPIMNPVSRDADSFRIRYSYTDPVTARRVTERLGGLFIDVNAQDRNSLAQATEQFLASQLEESKKRLEETERRLQRFREQNAGRLPTQLAYNMQAVQNAQNRAQTLAESIVRDRDQLMLLGQLLKETQAQVYPPIVAPTPGGKTTLTDPAAAAGTLDQQIAAARQTLVGLELRLKPEHPDVVRTKSLIATLEAQLDAERAKRRVADDEKAVADSDQEPQDPREVARATRVRDLTTQMDSLTRQITRKEAEEEETRQSIIDLQRRIEEVPGVESDWISLTRDYDTQFTKYKELLGKSENAQLAANLEERQIGEQFRILDPARVPVKPIAVNRLKINGIGAGVGFALGLMLAAFLELRDRTFRQADDIVEVLKLPVVALVPQVVGVADRQRARTRKLLGMATAMVLIVAAGYGFWALKLWNFVV
jgi:polysaccharide chain length determinant protein (PEP-CTERM system associated)